MFGAVSGRVRPVYIACLMMRTFMQINKMLHAGRRKLEIKPIHHRPALAITPRHTGGKSAPVIIMALKYHLFGQIIFADRRRY